MAPFIKLVGSSRGVRDDGGRGHRDEANKVAYVRTDEIREVCEVRGIHRFRVKITEAEYKAGVATDPDEYYVNRNIKDEWWKYVPTVELTFATRGDDHAHMLIASSSADMLAAIDKLENPDPAPRLVDRGEWTVGASYMPGDYVTKPGTTETYLAVAPSRTNSVIILNSAASWCKITLPKA